jgi:hypothetical protein
MTGTEDPYARVGLAGLVSDNLFGCLRPWYLRAMSNPFRYFDHEGEVLETVVTAKRDKAAALKFLKRIMKKYGRPRTVVTDGLSSYPAATREIGRPIARRLGVDATTARKIRISRFDDENESCSGFEAQGHYRNSAPFMVRSIIISTTNVISSPAKSTNRGA